MQNLLPKIKEFFIWLKDSDSQALQHACRNLDRAYKNFFEEGTGFPKFKSKKAGYQSYTTTAPTLSMRGSNRIHLPKVGNIRIKNSFMFSDDINIKQAVLTITPTGKYFITICVDEPRNAIPDVDIDIEKVIGFDYKSDGLYEDSEGYIPGSPKYYRKLEKKLAHLERLLSKKKGSKKGELKSGNYLKLRYRINRLHEKIANTRKDFLDKLSTEIANRYDAVCVEDLDMKAMSNKGFGNGKATLDNGWGMFIRMLEYKLADRGKKLIKVDKWYPSSQLCSCCGYQNPDVKNMNVKDWTCPECGTHHDRDHNAAINIRLEGIRILMKEGCLVDKAA